MQGKGQDVNCERRQQLRVMDTAIRKDRQKFMLIEDRRKEGRKSAAANKDEKKNMMKVCEL